jgi:hypothetical protein
MFLLLTAMFSFCITLSASAVSEISAPEHTERYLVQAVSVNAARRCVLRVGATVEQNLPIVNGVAARLSASQADRLRAAAGVRLFADRALTTSESLLSTLTSATGDIVSTTLVTAGALPVVSGVTSSVVAATSGNSVPQDGTGVNTPTLLYQTNYPMLVGADTLQQAGITGAGVTIAMLDSGLWQAPSQNYGGRILGTIDVTNGGPDRSPATLMVMARTSRPSQPAVRSTYRAAISALRPARTWSSCGLSTARAPAAIST